jgi:hypothetical protein
MSLMELNITVLNVKTLMYVSNATKRNELVTVIHFKKYNRLLVKKQQNYNFNTKISNSIPSIKNRTIFALKKLIILILMLISYHLNLINLSN